MMKAPHSHSYPLLSALLFFFFVTWSSSGSLLSIWLHQEVGLKAGDTGIIYAVLSVSALFAQVCYGFIQDKLGLRKHLDAARDKCGFSGEINRQHIFFYM